MLRSLSSRLALVSVGYLLLLAALIGTTVALLQRQQDDGLLVNLSGRQRMLTQRLTHQLLGYSRKLSRGEDAQVQRNAAVSTLRVFDRTLDALEYGGPAPLDLDMNQMRSCPPASPPVAEQLRRVRALWIPYRDRGRMILDGDDIARTAGETYVLDHNTELLGEMNTAVTLMQGEAEARVMQLYWVQGFAMVLGIIVGWLTSAFIRRGVLEPLRELNHVSDSMSRGEVGRHIAVEGPLEIAQLGASFERLRVAMKNLLRPSAAGEFSDL